MTTPSCSRRELRDYLLHELSIPELARVTLEAERLRAVESALACDPDGSLHEMLAEERLKLISSFEFTEAALGRLVKAADESREQKEGHYRQVESIVPEELRDDFAKYIGRKPGEPSAAFLAFADSNPAFDAAMDAMVDAVVRAIRSPPHD